MSVADAGIWGNIQLMSSPSNSQKTPQYVLACFDESGKLSDSEVVVFGGCVGDQETWNKFGTIWNARLDEEKLAHVSMKEAIHFSGAFSSWAGQVSRRDKLLSDLALMICDSPLLRIVTPVTTSEFKALPPEQRKRLGNDVQYCAFESCLLAALNHNPDFHLHVACDLSEEYSEKCISLFNKIRARNTQLKNRCLAISFADDRFHFGIQAADVIAYCARAQRTVAPQKPVVEMINALFASQESTVGHVFYKAYVGVLGSGEIEKS